MAHSALFDHIKLRRLCKRLNIPRPHAIGYLECLARYAADHAVTGDLSNLSDEDIEMAAEWEGKHGVFLAAVIAERFIDRDTAGTRLHDWEDWCPEYVRKRIQRHRAAAARRTTADNGGQCPPHDADPSLLAAAKGPDVDLQAVTSLNGGQRQTTADNGCPRKGKQQSQSFTSRVVHRYRGVQGGADGGGTAGDAGGKDSDSAAAADGGAGGRPGVQLMAPPPDRRQPDHHKQAMALLSARLPRNWAHQPTRMKAADLVIATDPTDKDTTFPMAVAAVCEMRADGLDVLMGAVLDCLSRPRENPRGWLRESLKRRGITP